MVYQVNTSFFNSNYDPSREGGTLFHQEFTLNTYVKLPSFFNNNSFQTLKAEVLRIFEQHSRRRDFLMKQDGNTPRFMSNVSGNAVAKHSSLIPAIYHNSQLMDFLSGIAGTQVYVAPDIFERHAIHRLEKRGDVHGGHLDTYAFVFVIFIQTPPEELGGGLEFVPHSMEISDLDTPLVHRIGHNVGDCYFMKANKTVHRVSPLLEEAQRTNIIFTYADEETQNIDISYSSDTLYG